MNVWLKLAFPHSYEVEVLEELPPSMSNEPRHFYFPGANSTGGRDGVLVKVSPKGAPPWLGTFASGFDSSNTLSGVFSCPAQNMLCVVSSGSGFLLDSASPHNSIEVESIPVLDVRSIVERQLLVFVDFTSLSAYGPEGLSWKTPDLSWDGIKITSLTPDTIEAVAWDAPLDRSVKVQVDLRTGEFIGGASPALKR